MSNEKKIFGEKIDPPKETVGDGGASAEKEQGTLSDYREQLDDDNIPNAWRAFEENPQAFLAEENLEKLEKLNTTRRLLLLRKCVVSLKVAPREVAAYFNRFPEDLRLAREIFEHFHEESFSTLDLLLTIASMPLIYKDLIAENPSPQLKARAENALLQADRWNLAKEHLLTGDVGIKRMFEKYGGAMKGVDAALREASELKIAGNHFIDPAQMFTAEFEALPVAEQTHLLCDVIRNIQYTLVFDEVFNSAFSPEMIAKDNARARQPIRYGDIEVFPYNPDHSMLYGTIHPPAIYHRGGADFAREMNTGYERGGFIEEYAYHRLLLAAIDRLGNLQMDADAGKQTAQLLIDFWKKNRDPIFIGSLAHAISRLAPDYAVKKLTEVLRFDEGDTAHISSLLYRIELGKSPLTEEGLDYLGHRYDLGEFNHPRYFAQRISRQSHVGVFSRGTDELEGFFQSAKVQEKDTVVLRREILRLTSNLLMRPRKGEGDEERAFREELLATFRKKYTSYAESELFEGTAVRFHNLTLREQGWLVYFLEHAAEEERAQVKTLINRYQEQGLTAFLAMEYGDEMGPVVLGLAEKLPPEVARKVFYDYARMADFATAFMERLVPLFESEEGERLDSEEWYEIVMRRARDFLLSAYDVAVRHKGAAPITYGEIIARIETNSPSAGVERCHQAILREIAVLLANHLSIERVRDLLGRSKNASADLVLQLINPEAGKEMQHSLVELYSKIRFEEYAVNEAMQETDLAVLAPLLSTKERVLDLGTGVGRHLKTLRDRGYMIDGIDIVPRHASITKKITPEAPMALGDWTMLPYADASYQTVFALGRNILHEFQLHRQRRLFQEVSRVLKAGGTFTFDIPDRGKGNYKKLVDGYASKMEEQGINAFRYGTIYDSPDDKHFFTRYAYNIEDIEDLAAATGFRIKSLTRKPLATHEEDENIYITLEKVMS